MASLMGYLQKKMSNTLDNIVEGNNRVTLTLPMDTGHAFDAVNVNEVVIHYPRQFVAQENRLSFESNYQKYRLQGFTAEALANGADDLIVIRQDSQGITQITNPQVACRSSCLVAIRQRDWKCTIPCCFA